VIGAQFFEGAATRYLLIVPNDPEAHPGVPQAFKIKRVFALRRRNRPHILDMLLQEGCNFRAS
jgi:hypothetical protein